MRQLSEMLLIVEPVAYDKLIVYRKALVIGYDIRLSPGRLVEQRTDLHRLDIFICEIDVFQILERDSRIDDILHQKDMSALEADVRLLLIFT